jgi:methionyl-tRNA synthetase
MENTLGGLLRLGEAANETFHIQEPWKTIKADKDKAEQTIALSLVYILAINSLFRPFLPRFSETLSEYFKPYLKPNTFDNVYKGDMSAAQEIFKNGYKLPLTPGPLLPRIDPKKVEPFKLELQAKH